MTELIKRPLLSHQLNGVLLLEKMEKFKYIHMHNNKFINTTVGIYSDKGGSGKTTTILALIARNKMNWDIHNNHNLIITKQSYVSGMITQQEMLPYKRLNCSLIVVHSYLIKHWVNELNYTNLKYIVMNTRFNCKQNIESYDVVLCSHTMYNYFIQRYIYSHAFKRFIMDLPEKTHISYMKRCISGFNWFISNEPIELLTTQKRSNMLKMYFPNNMPIYFFEKLVIDNSHFQNHFDQNMKTYYRFYKINSNFESDSMCAICYEDIKNITQLKKCKHYFCEKCIEKWITYNSTCPMCRQPFNYTELIHVTNDNNKTDMMKKLFNKYSNDKFIILSNKLLYLSSPIVTLGRLITKQKKQLQEFKTGNIQYLYIPTNVMKINLYLPEANHILFFDSDTYNRQYINMIKRIGQKKSVYIHRLM